MTDGRDPVRWKDAVDAPPRWSEAVHADDDAGPDAATLERMLRGVANELGRPELTSQLTAAKSAASFALAPFLKLGLACVGLAAGVAGLVAYVGMQVREAEPHPAIVAPTQDVEVPAAIAPAPERYADSPQPSPAETAPAPAERTSRASKPAPAPAGRTSRASTPAAPPAERTSGASPPDRKARPASKPGSSAPTDPVAEVALLERAQRSLAIDPGASVALAAQHRKEFPRGALAQEREMLAIDALLRLGERAAAERRARAFERAYPSSSHRARLADLLSSRR